MRVDQLVCRTKFEQEVERLLSQTATLKKWGVFVYDITFPVVDVVFVPRHHLNIHVPTDQPPPSNIIIPKGAQTQIMAVMQMNVLSARSFGTRISLEDFDQVAPSVEFLDPWTWKPLMFDTDLCRANHVDENGKTWNVLLNDHPIRKRPFLCLRGIREYHEHPQHTGDDWMLYRKHSGLFSTVQMIWNTCIHNATPQLLIQPPNIQVQWTPAKSL